MSSLTGSAGVACLPTLYAQIVVTLPASMPIVPAHSAAARLAAFEHIQLTSCRRANKMPTGAETSCLPALVFSRSGGDSFASPAAPLSTFIQADAASPPLAGCVNNTTLPAHSQSSTRGGEKCPKRLLSQSDATNLPPYLSVICRRTTYQSFALIYFCVFLVAQPRNKVELRCH